MDTKVNANNKRPPDTPFYEVPEGRITPSMIVNEARRELKEGPRAISTKRPETPRESHRQLFGESSTRDPANRPPSAISLNSRQYDSESRPVSGKRLMPIEYQLSKPELERALNRAPKPPADPNRPLRKPGSGSKTRSLQHSISVEDSGRKVQNDTDSGLPPLPVNISQKAEPRSNSAPKPRPDSLHNRVPKSDSDGVIKQHTTDTSPEQTSPSDEQAPSQRTNHEDGTSQRVSSGGTGKRTGSAGSHRSLSAGSTRGGGGDVRVGSGGRREGDETAEEAHLYNTAIGPIVEEMSYHAKGDTKDPERLLELTSQLYDTLEQHGLLGKACSRRSTILKILFKLFDVSNAKLWLKLARLILALKVSSANLLKCFKLVYQIAKDESNDTHFAEDNILDLMLESMGSVDPVGSAEVLIYCVGSLKNLSNSASVLKVLYKKGTFEQSAKTLSAIVTSFAEERHNQEQVGHLLVQMTSLLRNFAELSRAREFIISSSLIPNMLQLLDLFTNDRDIIFNVIRFLSKLTQHQDVCYALTHSYPSGFSSLLKLLSRHKEEHISVIVRVSYILGNLTSRLDKAREHLIVLPKALQIILDVLRHYLELDIKGQCSTGEREAKDRAGDVLIKTVRLVANLAINEEAGPALACDTNCRNLLLNILELKALADSEELVINTLSTINNLSYYKVNESAIYSEPVLIAEALLKFIQVDHRDGLAEATRVLGNLTRDADVRNFLVSRQIDEAMVAMLNSSHRDVVFTACGVLINLMGDADKRQLLKEQGGVTKLVEVLRDFGNTDWHISTLVCKTLWNYSGGITSTNSCFGDKEGAELAELLEDLLDEEIALSADTAAEEDMKEYYAEVWKNDFCPVASSLLQRIENFQSDLEPL